MLISHEKLKNCRVASRQQEARIGSVSSVVVDASNLEIACLGVKMPGAADDRVLHRSDIDRAIVMPDAKIGLVIGSADALIDARELDQYVKVKQMLQTNFNPIGYKVVSQDGHKLGKVSGFNFDDQSLTIIQLCVGSLSLSQRIKTSSLIISRSQIVEIAPDKIVVNSAKASPHTSLRRIGSAFRPAPQPGSSLSSPADRV